MKYFKFSLPIVLLIFMVYSCKKDFSIYAPYESATIVIGILDPGQDTQFVKINKTWQGTGNNLEYAQIRDSSEYKWSDFNDITVKEIVDGNVLNTYHLSEIERQDKDDDGIFFGPDYTAYYFVKTDDYLQDAIYRIDVDFVSNKDVWSETNIIPTDLTSGSGVIERPSQNTPEDNAPINMATVTSNNTIDYAIYKVKWTPYTNAFRYDASFVIRYKEFVWADDNHTDLVSSSDETIVMKLGERKPEDLESGKFTISIDGEAFYNLVLANLELDSKITREFGYYNSSTSSTEILEFKLGIANGDYDTYIDVNQPLTNIVQERPTYTNVIDGLGIWASRNTITLKRLRISAESFDVFAATEQFVQLNICAEDANLLDIVDCP